MLSEKIKTLRKTNNLTQEDLAEKLNVSRQAITKWESGVGTPDIGNIQAIARLFGVSMDELLSDQKEIHNENLSRTEFDVFEKSDFNLNVGTAASLDVTFTDQEKVIVEIRSDLPKDAYRLAKVKLTEGKHVDLVLVEWADSKKRINVKQDRNLSKQDAKTHLFIRMFLPTALADWVELEGNLGKLVLHDFIDEKHVEFDGRVDEVEIARAKGHFELTSNLDMKVFYDGSMKQLDINQLHAVSNLYITGGADLDIVSKGRACGLVFDDYTPKKDASEHVEFNGYKSELTVHKLG